VAILHVVARKLPRTRLLVILTARSNELRTVAGPSGADVGRHGRGLETLELEPLPREAASVWSLLGVAKAEARIADVPVRGSFRRATQSPALELLTKECWRTGRARCSAIWKHSNTQPAANIGIPRAIGAVFFDRQIRRLDPPTRAALDLAAVLGDGSQTFRLYEAWTFPLRPPVKRYPFEGRGFLRRVHGGLEVPNELIRAQAYYASRRAGAQSCIGG